MTRPHSRGTGGRSALLALFLALAAVLFGSGPVPAAGADGGWWEPTSRPAPDSRINVTGAPFTGTDAQGKVRGFVDAHNHLMSNEGFGGRLICGRTFSAGGAPRRSRTVPSTTRTVRERCSRTSPAAPTAITTRWAGRRSRTGRPTTP